MKTSRLVEVVIFLVMMIVSCDKETFGITNEEHLSTVSFNVENLPDFVSDPDKTVVSVATDEDERMIAFAISAIDPLGRIFTLRVENTVISQKTYELKVYPNDKPWVTAGFISSDPKGTWGAGIDDNLGLGEITIEQMSGSYLKGFFSYRAIDEETGIEKKITMGEFTITSVTE